MRYIHTSIHAGNRRFVILALAVLTFTSPLLTMGDINQRAARQLRATGKILPLEAIHAKARTIKPGKILETELEFKKGRYIYEVEILDELGAVWELKLDAATNALIELEED